MQTRAAAKKLASAEETAMATETSGSTDTSGCTAGNTKNSSQGSSKRKRSPKKQAQPLKGGWSLPHGMGVGVAGPDLPSPRNAQPTLPAFSALDLPSDTAGPTPSTPVVTLGSDGPENASKSKRQSRISYRTTKANTGALKDPPNYQVASIVKTGELDEHVIEQPEGRPSKRVRVTRTNAPETSNDTILEKGTVGSVPLKVEKDHGLGKPSPKVLIFKGVAVRDGIVVKLSLNIAVDATQILDPNLKVKVRRGKDNPYGLTPGFSPYPYRQVPTAEACEEVHRILTELHGEVKQPEKMPAASLEIAGCGEVPCVLDALLRTLISGNTLMAAADAAIKNLAEHYGLRQQGTGAGSINWEKVRLSSHQELAQVIRVAGNGPKRSRHIKQILDMVFEENLQRREEHRLAGATGRGRRITRIGTATEDLLSLDHMHAMTKDEAMAKFVSYPGIGIKTAACVTLFCLRMPCFAVDTHVHKFCRWLGWVPEKADPDNCFRHGDFMVPDHLKYGLHQLFIRHGQQCFKCRKITKPGTKDWNEAPDCPLEHLLDRSKDEIAPKKKSMRAKQDQSTATDGSESELDVGDGDEE